MDPDALATGLEYTYIEYDRRVLSVAQLAGEEPKSTGVSPDISLQVAERAERFGLLFAGYLRVPAGGIYTFTLGSDDGARLKIGDQIVVDNDGIHGISQRSGMIGLAEGFHPMSLSYFQRSRESELELAVTATGSGKQLEIENLLFH